MPCNNAEKAIMASAPRRSVHIPFAAPREVNEYIAVKRSPSAADMPEINCENKRQEP